MGDTAEETAGGGIPPTISSTLAAADASPAVAASPAAAEAAPKAADPAPSSPPAATAAPERPAAAAAAPEPAPAEEEVCNLLETTAAGILVFETYRRTAAVGTFVIKRFDAILDDAGVSMFLAFPGKHPSGGVFGVGFRQEKKDVFSFRQIDMQDMRLDPNKERYVLDKDDAELHWTQSNAFLNSVRYRDPDSRRKRMGAAGVDTAAAVGTAEPRRKFPNLEAAHAAQGKLLKSLKVEYASVKRKLSTAEGKAATSEKKRQKLLDDAADAKAKAKEDKKTHAAKQAAAVADIKELRGKVSTLKRELKSARNKSEQADEGKSEVVHELELKVASLTAQVAGLNNTITQLQAAFAAAPAPAALPAAVLPAVQPAAAPAVAAPPAPNAAALTAILGALLGAR